MKIEVLEKTKDSLKFKMINTRHTIPEMLKEQLLTNKDVSMASYILDHPEDPDAIFYVKVKKGDVKEAILNAIEELRKEIQVFTKSSLSQIPKEEPVKTKEKATTKKPEKVKKK